MGYAPAELEKKTNDQRLEEDSSTQQTPWYVGRGKIGDQPRSDVLSKIRRDFDAVGVAQSDEQILRVLNELNLQAGSQMTSQRGGTSVALTVTLDRKLKPNKDSLSSRTSRACWSRRQIPNQKCPARGF